MEPNAQQQAAIETLVGDVVLSAGAGTGKTATLARRFAHAVTHRGEGWEPAELREILAITFTRKAAAELAERVRRVLASEHDIAAARRVDEAWISTIDSFCGRIVRRHALEAGVDPGFGIASEVQSGAMRAAALDRVLTAARAGGGDAAALVAAYRDATVRDCLNQAYDRMRTMGLTPDALAIAEGEALERVAERYRTALADLAEGTREVGLDVATRIANVEACELGMRLVDEIVAGPSGERAGLVLEMLSPITFSAGAAPKDLAKAAQAARDELIEAAVGEQLVPHARAFAALLGGYGADYGAAKRAAGLMDHSDVTIAAARLFEARPDIAELYRREFRLLMIDEFQDTNEVQMRVFEQLRDDDLCVVGDDKQSIYGWRYADVEIFERLGREVDQRLPLSANYRSHPEVLSFVNAVFGSEAAFGSELKRLEPKRDDGPSERWPCGGPRTGVLAVDRSTRGAQTNAEAEAGVLGDRIAELVEGGARPGDIVVLMRAMTSAPAYAAAIRRHGVDVYLASGEMFFESAAVVDLRALLKVLIVPEDDEALVRVLAGPLVGVTADALFAMRTAIGPWDHLWPAVVDAAGGRVPGVPEGDVVALRRAVDAVAELRRIMPRTAVSDLLRAACDALDYDLTLLAMRPDGPRQWRNALKLVRMTAEWESATPGDVGALLEYLDLCDEHASKEPAAPLAGEEDAVRIMSVHSAKGLEFPIVFFADAGRSMTGSDTAALLVAKTDEGPLLVCKHPDDGSEFEGMKGPGYLGVQEHLGTLALAEELRIAYVACTRAEEAVFVVGGFRGKAPTASTYLGMFHRALGSPEQDAEVPTEAHSTTWTVLDLGSPEDPHPTAEVEPGAETRGGSVLEVASTPVSCAEAGLPLPASVSFTALKAYDTCPYSFYARYVLGLREIDDGSHRALNVGSAVHAVLEQSGSVETAEACAAAAVRYALGPDEVRRMETAVAVFEADPTAGEVAAADRVYRECPFALDVGGMTLVGNVDLIAWTEGRALIVDYKTGARHDAADGETQDRYELQARCYALAAFAAGAESVAVRFLFLEAGAERIEFVFDASDREPVAQGVAALVARIGEAGYRPLPAYSEHACRDCPALGGICPVDRPAG